MPARFAGLQISSNISETAWLNDQLTGGFGTVTRTVPRGFAAYARILHPPSTRDGQIVHWSHVAEITGGRAHALAQWHALSRSGDLSANHCEPWGGNDPTKGDLELSSWKVLRRLLMQKSGADTRGFYCWWTGYGQIQLIQHLEDDSGGPVTQTINLDQSSSQVHIKSREYLLFEGSLNADLEVDQSPNIVWPNDRSWCVATEIDYDSTLVAGSRRLIDSIILSPDLEAWQVLEADFLTINADIINTNP